MSPNVTPERIELAYQALGYKDGWRFMSCPEANFINPEVLLVTLNPGGSAGMDKSNPTWSQEMGSSYLHETWGNCSKGGESLQVQVQRMANLISRPIDRIASAYFVPFRSARWATLEKRHDALSFAKELWKDVVGHLNPKYVVCVGSLVGKYVGHRFGVHEFVQRPSGWGEITLGVGTTRGGGRFVSLPHLGTFKLFSRAGCIPHLEEAFGLAGSQHA